MKPVPRTIPSHTYQPTSDKNIMRFVDRDGDWTHYWIKNKKIFVPAVNHIIRLGYPKGDRFYNYLLRATPTEAERKLNTAGEEGSRSHEAIRDLINGDKVDLDRRYYNELIDRYEPLNADEWMNLEAFILWSEYYKPRVIAHETAVWSERFNYAGTVDFIGSITIPEGDKTFSKDKWGKELLIILDWKTSGGIWDEYELQVAAYRTAVLEYLSRKLPAEQFDGVWTGIVRLGTNHKTGYEMKLWNEVESEANFELFLSAFDIYRKKAGDEFVPDLRHIPAEFSVYIPKLRVRRSKNNTKDKKESVRYQDPKRHS